MPEGSPPVLPMPATAVPMWELLTALGRWVDEHNQARRRPPGWRGLLAVVVGWIRPRPRTTPHDTAMKIGKVGEEFGEACQAYSGYVGQNPRKGVTHTREQVAAELFDVALTALVAAYDFSDAPAADFAAHLTAVARRAGVLGDRGGQ
ncbi:MazG-like family protein [Streptosporangium sp. NPDC051023]|uniref:MazG-like family protein n=1 Tax=Streptosporangium sp. NPDC051023 TaxID=3155410 RepID=UPI003450B55F